MPGGEQPSTPTADGSVAMLEELAQRLAARLSELIRIAGEQEGCDLVHVSTAELCRALGKPDGATMDEVRSLVRLLLRQMPGRGVAAACGCGLLSLQVGAAGFMDRAVSEGRDLIVFTPEDIDHYLEEHLVDPRSLR